MMGKRVAFARWVVQIDAGTNVAKVIYQGLSIYGRKPRQ